MEAWPRPIHHDDFNFTVAATNVGTSGNSAIPARLLRTNFHQAPGLQLALESPCVSPGFSATRSRVSRHTRARDETIWGFDSGRRHAPLLAGGQYRQRICDVPGALVC